VIDEEDRPGKREKRGRGDKTMKGFIPGKEGRKEGGRRGGNIIPMTRLRPAIREGRKEGQRILL